MSKKKSSRSVPEEKAATDQEVRAAIDALTVLESVRLKKFASKRIKALGLRSLGRNDEDLLQAALTATVAGDRRWNKTVTFFTHVIYAMRSISWNWGRKVDPDREPQPVSHFILETGDGETVNVLDNSPVDATQDRQLQIKQQLDEIGHILKGDQSALDVFNGLRDKMEPAEIREALSMTKEQYVATVKRIQYRVRTVLS